jgi:hypothetical protein
VGLDTKLRTEGDRLADDLTAGYGTALGVRFDSVLPGTGPWPCSVREVTVRMSLELCGSTPLPATNKNED